MDEQELNLRSGEGSIPEREQSVGGGLKDRNVWEGEGGPIGLKHKVGGGRYEVGLVRSSGPSHALCWWQWEVAEREQWNGGGLFCFHPFDHSWKNRHKMIQTGCRETNQMRIKYSKQEIIVPDPGWWEPKRYWGGRPRKIWCWIENEKGIRRIKDDP